MEVKFNPEFSHQLLSILDKSVQIKIEIEENDHIGSDPLEPRCESNSSENCSRHESGNDQINGATNYVELENLKSKDTILSKTLYSIVNSHNLSKEITESLLKMLHNYGIKVPITKDALISEFEMENEGNCSKQIADLKIQMNKMQATIEQIKNAVLNSKLSVNDLCVSTPIQCERDLTLLDQQCAEQDLTSHFVKLKLLSDIIDDHLLLNYNWDGVQGKKKFSQYTNLHQTIFAAIKNEIIRDFSSYQYFMKAELRRVHNKLHQKLSRKRRSMKNYSNEVANSS